MTPKATLSEDGRTLTVRIPMAYHQRGGRKLVISPDGAAWPLARPRIDNAMVKALVRAFRWRKVLEAGVHVTIDDLAAAETINPSYVSRVLRLTLLAPAIVEAILDGRQPAEFKLKELTRPLPVEWERQLRSLPQIPNL
jgi:hypothetical protein